jgi:carboxylate-amine ligase
VDDALTLGVEEEFQLVDAHTLALASGYDALIRRAGTMALGHLHPEYYQCVVETTTDPCSTMEEVQRQTMALRATAIELAEDCGLALVSASTHPFSHWDEQRRTADTAGRYAGLEDVLQDVIREILIYGLHVHIGIADAERRLAVMNQARTYLPHILALTTNSPLWQGRPTGYQSFRTMVWAPFPVANVPDAYPTLRAYRDFHDLLVATGALRPPRRIWWDLRLHDTLPTLEFRIADMPANHADMVAVVAFIQALCKTFLDKLDQEGESAVVPTPVIAENKWRAARYGLGGTMIDYDWRREVTTRDAVEEALGRCAPAFEALGTTTYLAHLRSMLDPSYRTGAERQLAAYAHRSDSHEVVSMIIEETRRDVDPAMALPLAPINDVGRMRLRHGELLSTR